MENQSGQPPKKNSNVIYFLIVVVLALLGTDVYLYLQKNKSDTKIVYQEDEKNRLKVELDSLEAQIEQVSTGKAKMSAELRAKNDSLETKIRVLRTQLDKGKLTKAELNKAQEDVKQLRYFVANYTAQIEEQKKQITSLTTERDTLKTNLTTVSQKASTLADQNKDLDSKVQIAKALKVGAVNIVAYKVKSSGKEVEETRAKPTTKIKINFNVASNTLADKALHDVYVRVLDPTGNLITNANDAGNFTADGQSLQYTYKTSIDFKNDGSGFTIDWVSPTTPPFQKGTYTVILYSDGSTMGQGTLTLK
jgi:predicted nuclease with TOPRIM domain